MKHILKGFVIFILLLSYSNSFTQTSISDFTLDSDSVTVLGEQANISSIITKSDDIIRYSQLVNNEATNTMSFTINDSTGTWDESTSLGSITYTMNLESYEATLVLLGEASGISATLTFITDNTQNNSYIFNVSSISY